MITEGEMNWNGVPGHCLNSEKIKLYFFTTWKIIGLLDKYLIWNRRKQRLLWNITVENGKTGERENKGKPRNSVPVHKNLPCKPEENPLMYAFAGIYIIQ